MNHVIDDILVLCHSLIDRGFSFLVIHIIMIRLNKYLMKYSILMLQVECNAVTEDSEVLRGELE